MRLGRTRLIVPATLAAVALGGCDTKDERRELRVFMADSLYLPFKAATEAFEREHPDCRVHLVPSGSVLAARRITDANDQADLLAVADHLVIEKMLRPRFADWYACFAGNEVVIAYTQASRYAAELTVDNWFDVLSREGVKVGAANPSHDPCGYWAEISWQLADLHYRNVPAPSIQERMRRQCGPPDKRRSDTEELLQILESTAGIDYAFVYLSQASQHRLPVLRLPASVNLGDIRQVDLYRRASVTLPGVDDASTIEKRGDAIVYALTIPRNARHPDLAAAYVQHLLSPAGRKTLSEQYLNVFERPWTYDAGAVPAALKSLLASPPPSATAPSTSHADTSRAGSGA